MKALFELFPLVAFFAAYAYVDIFFATAVGMVASAIQVIWSWLKHKKVPTALWIGFGAFMVFGGLTLFLRDQRFVMLKPTIVYWLMAVGLLISYVGFKKNPIKLAMQSQFEPPEHIWTRWMLVWVVFFTLLGFVNIYVAQTFSEATWVKFKVFGVISLSLLLTIVQIWRMFPYAKQESQSNDSGHQ